jgi:hypothetical protein
MILENYLFFAKIMSKSEAWDDIQPAILTNPSIFRPKRTYRNWPDNIVDILIDEAETSLDKIPYGIINIQRFCKSYLRKHGYTFNGSIGMIDQVMQYFKENRRQIADSRKLYNELAALCK